jgi:GMP synthase (glutamine-hydrolysing)
VKIDASGDPLLGEFGVDRFQVSHVESVLELPPGAVRLGGNAADPNHAFRLGPQAWGVQFHPEFDADVIRGYIEGRREILESEGLDPDALGAATLETPAGFRLLRRFAEIVTRFEAA